MHSQSLSLASGVDLRLQQKNSSQNYSTGGRYRDHSSKSQRMSLSEYRKQKEEDGGVRELAYRSLRKPSEDGSTVIAGEEEIPTLEKKQRVQSSHGGGRFRHRLVVAERCTTAATDYVSNLMLS